MTLPMLLQRLNRRQYTRFYSTLKELSVPTFCNVEIDVPFSINIQPLNLHKYQNCDKLLIELDGQYDEEIFEIKQTENNVKITSNTTKNVDCLIQAPIKANLQVKSSLGITTGYFNGEKLILQSLHGDISVSKFQGDLLSIETQSGNIYLKDSIQCSKVRANIHELGSIFTEKIQGLETYLKTNVGNISVGSCYSQCSTFESVRGDMNLNNIHQICKILLEKGFLNLVGFDGTLEARIIDGNADIQLSRITGPSNILLESSKVLNLKISEECEKNTYVINSKSYESPTDFDFETERLGNTIKLTPKTLTDSNHLLTINCKDSNVNLSRASWQDMFELKYIKS